jgi:hypothetical protein
MSKIDLIIDALSVAQNSIWSKLNQEALDAACKLKAELVKPEECVCCGDYERCLKPCTPRGRWQGEQNAAAQFRKDAFAWDGDAWGELAKTMSRDFVERAKKNWESPPKVVDTITMAELRQTDLYRKVQTQLLRDILRGDST